MISIIITTFNRARNLDNCLFSLATQEILNRTPYEIIVVDDGSTDCTRGVVGRYSKMNIRYLYNVKVDPVFRSPAVAFNIGLVYAKGDVIVQLGSDIVMMDQHTLGRLYSTFEEKNCYIASNVRRISEHNLQRVVQDNSFYDTIGKYSTPYTNGKGHFPEPFCAIYMKKWAYEIGLYDEEYNWGGGEDTDFVCRMQRIVPTIWCCWSTVCHQDHSKFSGRVRDQDEYSQNLTRLRTTQGGADLRWRKKIMFLASFNYYRAPGYLPDSLRQQFLRLGHRCLFYDPSPQCNNDDDIRSVNYCKYWRDTDKFKRAVEEFEPEIIVSCIDGTNKLLRENYDGDAFKACWYGDMRDPVRFAPNKGVFDLMFLTNEEQAPEYEELVGCRCVPVHFAVSHTGHIDLQLQKTYDVGFAGQPKTRIHTQRSDFLKKIDGLNVMRRSLWATPRFYNQCKIVISDSCDMDKQGYTSNRFFNVIGCGAFCLVRYFPGIEKFGNNFEHFVWFKDDDEGLKLIDRFLADDQGRARIARTGYEHFHRNFSWEKLAAKLNDEIRAEYELTRTIRRD